MLLTGDYTQIPAKCHFTLPLWSGQASTEAQGLGSVYSAL